IIEALDQVLTTTFLPDSFIASTFFSIKEHNLLKKQNARIMLLQNPCVFILFQSFRPEKIVSPHFQNTK
ncbi:hypothetical protein, partial [Bacteroides fragilis]|uniref:hypothetical protein n=1 Tax=Bacteroides fragilis TaxID=817 RepID=UPI0032ED97FA